MIRKQVTMKKLPDLYGRVTQTLIVIASWASLLCVLGVPMTTVEHSGSFNHLLPFYVMSGLCILLSIAGVAVRKTAVIVFWLVVPMLVLLPIPWWLAMSHFTGGKDGLVFFAGLTTMGCTITPIFAGMAMVRVVPVLLRERKDRLRRLRFPMRVKTED